MNAVVEFKHGIPALQMAEDELVKVLQSSMYPGAALESIKMVVGYCKASQLDPMQKPVHIVPMWDSKSKAMRDVIMPGVGLYRTQAARSNALAGISEPEFGPEKSYDLAGVKISAPEWCRVTVKRQLPSGIVAEFSAIEYWIENYAVRGGAEKSVAPNAMWSKRPRGQLAKCAQAQALRTAFPEMTGAAPTADEMEGRALDDSLTVDAEVVERLKPAVSVPKAKPAPADVSEHAAHEPQAPASSAEALAEPGEIAYIVKKAKEVGVDLDKLCVEKGVADIACLTKAEFGALKAALLVKP